MLTAYVAVTLFAAGMIGFSAYAAITGAPWVRDNLASYGVSQSWLLPLGALKSAGALGLVVGMGLPLIGVGAALGLVVYFVGAVAIVVRAHCYSHIGYPVAFLLPAAASLVLLVMSHGLA